MIKLDYLTLCIHTVLTNGMYISQISSCKAHSKEKRYDLIKNICENSKDNQKLIQEHTEALEQHNQDQLLQEVEINHHEH